LVCDRKGRQKRVSLGTYPAITLAEARAEARKIIRDAQLGVFNDDQDTSCPTLGKTVPPIHPDLCEAKE
jgi:Arm domain-containing DNA-binding protein